MKKALLLTVVLLCGMSRMQADANCLTRYYCKRSEMGSFAPTVCNCPCERYLHVNKRSKCARCGHGRIARDLEPVTVTREEMQQLAQLEQQRMRERKQRTGWQDLEHEADRVYEDTYSVITGPLEPLAVVGGGPRRLGPVQDENAGPTCSCS